VTAIETPTLSPFTPVTFDLYNNIHKGIRSELFDVVLRAGRIDPSDRRVRSDFAVRVGEVVELLESHARHEDDGLEAVLAEHLPQLGEKIAAEHAQLGARLVALRELASGGDAMHRLYLELASFTSAYLAHQDFEERTVMPAVEDAIGVEAVVAIHEQIVGSIPPPEMASSLAIMLPAMNIDDRAGLLGGMRASAPADVFAGVWGLAGSVLSPADYAALAGRLRITDV
jgi:hypothetical protein